MQTPLQSHPRQLNEGTFRHLQNYESLLATLLMASTSSLHEASTIKANLQKIWHPCGSSSLPEKTVGRVCAGHNTLYSTLKTSEAEAMSFLPSISLFSKYIFCKNSGLQIMFIFGQLAVWCGTGLTSPQKSWDWIISLFSSHPVAHKLKKPLHNS